MIRPDLTDKAWPDEPHRVRLTERGEYILALVIAFALTAACWVLIWLLA